jgi:hypothetical protein
METVLCFFPFAIIPVAGAIMAKFDHHESMGS